MGTRPSELTLNNSQRQPAAVKTDGVRFAGDATAKADDIDLHTRRMLERRVHRPLDLGIGPSTDYGKRVNQARWRFVKVHRIVRPPAA